MVTLADLKLKSRQRADMVNSKFVDDTELAGYLNNSYAELYDILIATDANYYLTVLPFTLANGANIYPLPTDFYKLKGLDYASTSGGAGTSWVTVSQFIFNERNNTISNAALISGTTTPISYILQSNQLYLLPETQAGGTYRMWYIPRYVPLVNDTDTLDGINGFEEYVIVDAAIKMLQKEESDVTVLMSQKQSLLSRIQSMAADRDYSSPKKVSNTQPNQMFSTNFLFLG